jgi:hypothetical protein
MGGYPLWMAFRFAISGTDQEARHLSVASICILRITLGGLAFARLKKAESLEVPAIIAVGGLEPSKWIFEFFTVPIRNKNRIDGFRERVLVCRDFTHLAITLCRCMNIPARYATGYLGDIGVPSDPNPMDFSAWFEAYLGGH